MLRPSPRIGRDRRVSPALIALAAATLGACNAIFGIEPGEPTGGKGGTGGATSSTSAGGGGASSSSSSSGGAAPPGCGLDAGALTGTTEKLRPTFAPGAEVAFAAVYDAQGNAIVVGSFDGPHVNLGGGDLAHGPGVDNDNLFVVKYGPDKNHLWSKPFGGDRDVVPHAVAAAPNGDVWVTGLMYGSVQLGSTPALVTATDGVNDYPDAFIAKLDASGEVVWAKRYGNKYVQAGVSVAIDSAGNGVVSGVGWDQYDIGGDPLGTGGTWSAWVAKLDPDGNTLWSNSYLDWDVDVDNYGEYQEAVVAIDKNDDVFFASVFDGPAFFDGDLVATLGADAYVLKLDRATGDILWKTFLTGGGDTDAGLDGDQWPSAIAADPCTGDVYVAGSFTNRLAPTGLMPATVTVGSPSDNDMFVVKLAGSSGEPVWLRAFGDAGYQNARGLAVDRAGNIAFAGFVVDAPGYVGVDFGDPVGKLGPVPAPDPNDPEPDAFIVKLDPEGKTIWAYRYGDTAFQSAQGVAVDADGRVLLVGAFDGEMNVPPKVPVQSDYFDAFMVWLSP